MSFGLSGSGELIRLYDKTGALVDTVYYLDESPWPTEPDGDGPSLELIAPHLDNGYGENWMASPLHGTPGAMNSMMVGVSENENKTNHPIKLMIYPNPVTSEAIVELNTRENFKNAQIEVFNIYGSKIIEINDLNTNSIQFDCENLPSGIYSVRLIFNENQSLWGKMVVK